jgi:hypothetical protein
MRESNAMRDLTRCLLLLAIACAASLLPATARAHGGDGEGIGPVFGYSGERSWSFGWEASVTRGGPFAKLSLGGIYHVAPNRADPFTIHYLVLEPWFVVGGTLGLAVADGPQVARLAYGLWEGLPIELNNGDSPFGDSTRHWMLTFTIGWRGFGRTQQIFFTPKLWSFASLGWFN